MHNRSKNLMRGLVGFGLMLLAMAGAYAQVSAAAGAPQIQQYLSATPSGDLSVAVFTAALGSFFTSPFTQVGAPTTVVGTVFMMFNAGIFAIGMVWVTYGIGAGIIQTAHEGVVLGKRFNPLWMPIRMTMGIGGLAPIFSGYSLSQAVMMFLASLGIGLCNFMWTGAVGMMSGGQPLISPAFMAPPTGGSSYEQAAQAIFIGRVCQDAWNSNQATVAATLAGQYDNAQPGDPRLQGLMPAPVPAAPNDVLEVTNPLDSPAGQADPYQGANDPSSGLAGVDPNNLGTAAGGAALPAKTGVSFDGPQQPAMCGSVWVANDGQGSRQASSLVGFRVASVNYPQLGAQVQQAYVSNFPAFKQQGEALADAWWNQYVADSGTGNPAGANAPHWPLFPQAQLAALAQNYAGRVQAAVGADGSSQTLKALDGQARQEMLRYGWFGAGGWYATMSELQSSVDQAAQDVVLQVSMPTKVAMTNSTTGQALAAIMNSYTTARRTVGHDGSLITTPTGNMSLGQAVVSKIIDMASAGTPGQLAGSGTPLVDPIMGMKNLGDYLMTLGEAPVVSKVGLWATEIGAALTGQVEVAAGAQTIRDAMNEKLGGVIEGATVLFFLGAFLSLYIPLVPFIHWWSGILQYVTVVFEGLAAAPLWAFAHLDANGEGLGGRTERGYIFALNVLFRPALMLIGFILAAGVMLLLGSVLAALFLPAMANMQGNSVTGVASVIGFVILYGLLNLTLISGAFNLVSLLPDQVLGWIGHSGGMQLGKEVGDKVHGLVVASMGGARRALPPKRPSAPDETRGGK